MVICLEQGADLHTSQLMPLLLTVSCFSKIQIGFTFLVPAHPGSPGQRAVKWVCVCVTWAFMQFCSLEVLGPRVGNTMDNSLHLSLSSVILTDSSTGSPVHVLMLSIEAVRGLHRLRAPGIVPCIISFSRQLPCFLMA